MSASHRLWNAEVDWFERLTGFREASYAQTRAKLRVTGDRLRSTDTGASYAVGKFLMPSLGELRGEVAAVDDLKGRLRFTNIVGDVRRLHRQPEYEGALFQVASQFNMLEMASPALIPEDGVTRYAHDRTQGPACAIAAGAATIYRNYFVDLGDQVGQTAERQLDGLADIGEALAQATDRPVGELWTMRNGYALCSAGGLKAIGEHLRTLDEAGRDQLRARLRIGVHRDVEVTDGALPGPHVTQAFCSALPVAYASLPKTHWARFATLVLEAAYEATLLEGVLNARRGASDIVLLTRLGGGVFGNNDRWIDAALTKALRLAAGYALDVRLVSYGAVPPAMRALEAEFGSGAI